MCRNSVFNLGTRFRRTIQPDLPRPVSPYYEALLRHEVDFCYYCGEFDPSAAQKDNWSDFTAESCKAMVRFLLGLAVLQHLDTERVLKNNLLVDVASSSFFGLVPVTTKSNLECSPLMLFEGSNSDQFMSAIIKDSDLRPWLLNLSVRGENALRSTLDKVRKQRRCEWIDDIDMNYFSRFLKEALQTFKILRTCAWRPKSQISEKKGPGHFFPGERGKGFVKSSPH